MSAQLLTLVSSTNSDSLTIKYNRLIDSAQTAYLFGHQEKAANCYQEAFKISLKILQQPSANRVSINRIVEVCNYCFDYCPIFDDSDDFCFLEAAADTLGKLVQSQTDLKIRKKALDGLKNIACLACELVRFNQSIRCQVIIDHYVKLESTHARYLSH
ncbi:hypothetical protein [Pseudoalteromonas luteoviolacea]|uniref:Uncharacterized protein n=1 Tax=Pseudoalteromonas luteoviolacea S4054 TaxID=1129367 RepID=A0A0F6A858_9GAMM|nr:hypothetical protein [Pseudoalteromonas luteoviolacea]AOT07815.1 hypothetical protein S4054249_08160 [Pseudoalteromonas luteoviolacea]AOT12731.1 hypothetical protein S40542_08160 [Pseudoalteromonas luteoviolacea]AOT17644.1 hypothetical protein S4054_08155 [Pseudoalteromonas luteoviolacea]KKE82303.1 hypothetical protein N479_18870 [Pseudoalteromonas luteoviolacea S4054]KZN78955.1 hypothetical protein N481_00500 [Pseudoalteromonas luteoviolacea S4047-1]